MTIYDKMNVTKDLTFTLSMLIEEIDWVVSMIEEKKELTEADEKVLMFAKHLQKKYQ